MLDSIGVQVQLNHKANGSTPAAPFFPETTGDAVYVNENGNTLTEILPTDVSDADAAATSAGNPIFFNTTDNITVSENLAKKLLGITTT